MCAIHAKRVTIMPEDIQLLARRIKGERAKAISQKPSVSVLERFDCNGLVVVKPFALFNLIVHQLGDT